MDQILMSHFLGLVMLKKNVTTALQLLFSLSKLMGKRLSGLLCLTCCSSQFRQYVTSVSRSGALPGDSASPRVF